MRILAIDPGTKCGWAITPEESGVWDLSVRWGESDGMRFIRLEKYLREILPTVDFVVYEKAGFAPQSTRAAHVRGGIEAHIIRNCIEQDLQYEGIPVGTIKKFATGKGNSNKRKMLDAAKEMFPEVHIKDDNHADALCLLAYAMDNYELSDK